MGVQILRPGRKVHRVSPWGAAQIGRGGAQSYDWWLGGGTIDSANVLEHVESPSIGQLYAGGSVSDASPFTVAVKTSNASLGDKHLFSSADGRLYIGMSAPSESVYSLGTGWVVPAFVEDSTQRVYMWVFSGASVSVYRDNSLIGSNGFSKGIAQSGDTKWRSRYSTGNTWIDAVPVAAVYNIALSSAQRTGLYNSMAAQSGRSTCLMLPPAYRRLRLRMTALAAGRAASCASTIFGPTPWPC